MYELLIAALATWEVIEIWRHSSLTASWRARVELWEGTVGGRLRELLSCSFCMSPWVALAVLALLAVSRWCGWPGLGLLVTVLAVARLANLGNDLTYGWCRTPRHDTLDISPDASEEEAGDPYDGYNEDQFSP